MGTRHVRKSSFSLGFCVAAACLPACKSTSPGDGASSSESVDQTAPAAVTMPAAPINSANLAIDRGRVVAYVHLPCGFGRGTVGTVCLASPDPNVNWIEKWEEDGVSPITHYILSFASFKGTDIQTDPDPMGIWDGGGGSTDNFKLEAHVAAAMKAAQAHGKKVILSLGGEAGSSGFVSWWNGQGTDRVGTISAKLAAVASKFEAQNGFALAGYDIDIELGAVYTKDSDKYNSTRDLIRAVPDNMFVAFVPQAGNGLCAAPQPEDNINQVQALGGQCDSPQNDDRAWVLTKLDQDAKKADGSPKLDYFGMQYYNAGQALCCGGGGDQDEMTASAVQHYSNLSNGWEASTATSYSNSKNANGWPAPWPAFAGVGADRMVLGKPACNGCAGSNYMDIAHMKAAIQQLDGKLTKPMGGILFWDLGRLFGNSGAMCISGQCQPSWGGVDTLTNLTALKTMMDSLKQKSP